MTSRRRTLWTSIGGVLAVTLYAAWAAVQILVLNPLAAVPGVPLSEIHATMTAEQQWQGPAPVLTTLGSGILIAVVAAIFAVTQRVHPIVALVSFLTLLVFGAPAYFIASFGPGMGLADTYLISGGDASPWAWPLYAISIAAGITALGVPIALARRRAPLRASA